jgi:DNA replication and repair protein RecF
LPYLKKISLTQFRNYDFKLFSFDAPYIGITGLNGSGKTNLLDAIYYLCYTKSYFQSRENNNVQYGKEGFRIEGQFLIQEQIEKIACTWREGKKTVSRNDLAYEKVTEHIGKVHAVMIAPDDIALINEGSDLRRKYIDGLLSQRDEQYLIHLLAYHKFLAQRNACLKQANGYHVQHDLLDIYDEQMAIHGAYIIQERSKLAAQLPSITEHYYARLSGDNEPVGIHYRQTCAPEQLLLSLQQSRRRDIEYKRSLVGPHTEDWLFSINHHSLKAGASQGQKKSFLISLKLSQIALLHQNQTQPLLLLDDIFEKLDAARLTRLFALIAEFGLMQTFMTHTQGSDFERLLPHLSTQLQLIQL